MKILHTEASTGWGGQEIRILDESAGFIARGNEVRVAAPAEAPIIAAAAKRNISTHSLPLNRRRPPSLRALRGVIDEFKPDIIVTHSSSDSWLSAFAAPLSSRQPAIVRLRHISAPVRGGLLNRWLYGRVPARVVTTGEAIRKMLIDRLRLDPAHIVSIPTGTDHERFKPGDKASARRALGLPENEPIIGIVATLRSWKGHRFLVSAMNDRRLAGSKLVIVGDGPQEPLLREQIQQLGLSGRVRLAGKHDDVLPWLQAFDVFALPSTGNEGVPQALMQAMACALPAVTTNAGAIPELARDGENALIVPTENVPALAAAIEQLLNNRELGKRLGAAGRREVEAKHSTKAMLDAMEAVFRAAVGQPAA
jgi:glycosyltransferase involved in cell wall biosynthesis